MRALLSKHLSQRRLQLLDWEHPPFLGCYNSIAATVFPICKTWLTSHLALWPLSELPAGKENIAHA